MATRWWTILGCSVALLAGCGKSKGSADDGGAGDTAVSFDVAPDVASADAPADAGDAPASTDVRDAGASTDVGVGTDGRPSRPYVDPVDGAAGCPDGGFPGPAPCDVEMPLYGGINYNYGASGAGCTYPTWSRLWFTSNGVEVHIDLTAPIVAGAVGNPLAASIWINTNPMDFADQQKIWATPTGACTITLHGNVCWYFADQRYQIVSGRGTCSAPAVAAKPDGGAPVTIGDFWFSELLNPM